MFNMQPITGAAAVAAVVFFNVQIATAGPIFDFNWSGETLSAIGTMEISDDIKIGDSFNDSDVLSIEIEFFNGDVSLESIAFPPFPSAAPTPDVVIDGTRTASSLSLTDFYIFDRLDTGIIFGCDLVECANGGVTAPGGTVNFGSQAAALTSFVFTTTIPEPATASVFALGMGVIACTRSRHRRA